MADLGDTSMAGTAHKHQVTSWITVVVLIVSSIVIGVAAVIKSVPVGVVGAIIGLVGIGMLIAFKVMDDAH